MDMTKRLKIGILAVLLLLSAGTAVVSAGGTVDVTSRFWGWGGLSCSIEELPAYSGTTPVTFTNVPPGTYTVVVPTQYSAGHYFKRYSRKITVTEGQVTTVEPYSIGGWFAFITMNSNPQGARVYLDGLDTGVTTPYYPNIPDGVTYAVKLTRSGYQDYEGTMTVPRVPCLQIPGSICVPEPIYPTYTFDLQPDPVPTPEFPSAILPATLIIGFLGAVMFIQKTREH